MTRSAVIKMMALVFLATLLVAGCVTLKSSGLFVAPGYKGDTITLKQIRDNLDNFDVFFMGLTEEMPTALLFDPKDDDKRVVGDRWEKVTNLDKIDDMIAFVKSFTEFDPRLFAVMGPDNQVYGYLLSPRVGIATRVIDDKTIYIYGIRSPLYLDKRRFF